MPIIAGIGDQFEPHAAAMATIDEIKQLFTTFNVNMVTKIDNMHTRIVNISDCLDALEQGPTNKASTNQLEQIKRQIATKLEQTTKEAMIKAGREFLKE